MNPQVHCSKSSKSSRPSRPSGVTEVTLRAHASQQYPPHNSRLHEKQERRITNDSLLSTLSRRVTLYSLELCRQWSRGGQEVAKRSSGQVRCVAICPIVRRKHVPHATHLADGFRPSNRLGPSKMERVSHLGPPINVSVSPFLPIVRLRLGIPAPRNQKLKQTACQT